MFLVCAFSVCGVSCINFKLEQDTRRCIREEVHKDVLVVGEYDITDVQDQRTDLLVGAFNTIYAFSGT